MALLRVLRLSLRRYEVCSSPKMMRLNSEWVEKTWRDWALYRLENLSQDEMGSVYELLSEFTTMSVLTMNYWLGKFVLEGQQMSG